ncbi:MAG: TIGR03790 family protein [Pseudomonadota bacterium]
MPYKLSGLVEDISGTGAIATVSLDAAMFLGPEFAAQEEAYYNPLYQDGSSLTGVYDPFVDVLLAQSRVYDDWGLPVYLVTRIDGAGADAALDLIDRTAEAEALAQAGALAGNVYVDARWGDSPPTTDAFGSYEGGDWNMWGTAAVFEQAGAYPVIFDSNPEEFGTAPAPIECPDALYYAGWYSYYNYNDCFVWAPGAIGGHLDSCSACTLRDGGTWAAEALERGITATFGAVSEPYVAGMPEYDQFFLYLLQGATFAGAAYEATVVGGWMMVWVGDPLYRPYPEPLLEP